MSRQIQTTANPECLIRTLASRDGVARQKARRLLVTMGKPATPSLIRALRNSTLNQVRWEAVKALGAICDARAIPSLVKALEDHDPDVAWLAAEALEKFRKAAWPVLLRTLIRQPAYSDSLRQGVHHVLRNQREEGFNDVLDLLLKALEDATVPEMVPVAAHNLLERMNSQAGDEDHGTLGIGRHRKRTP